MLKDEYEQKLISFREDEKKRKICIWLSNCCKEIIEDESVRKQCHQLQSNIEKMRDDQKSYEEQLKKVNCYLKYFC